MTQLRVETESLRESQDSQPGPLQSQDKGGRDVFLESIDRDLVALPADSVDKNCGPTVELSGITASSPQNQPQQDATSDDCPPQGDLRYQERPQSEELCNSANKRRLFHEVKDAKSRNIVIFGETGTGKSSLINMLSDSDVAMVSNGALGCTFGSTGHNVQIDGARYTLWDTAGLNEGETGHVPADQALRNLRDLVHLKLRDGISLLVYCIRGTRYRDILKVNYDIFADIICQGEIPVVIVITGLENETRMEDWWDENKSDFAEPRFHFRGHVCITATRGKKDKEGVYTFEEEYKQSRIAIRSLIKEQCPDKVWAADSDQWVNRITQRIAEYYDQHNRHSQTYQGNYVGIMAPHAIMVAIDSWKYFRNFLRKIFRVLSFQEPLQEDKN